MTVQFGFGVATGLLISTLFALTILIRFVASDLDGFRRWLDKGGVV